MTNSSDTTSHYDLIVVGANVTGLFAATLAAKAERSVLLLQPRSEAFREPATTWISPFGAELLRESGMAVGPLLSDPITNCTFYLNDFTKQIRPQVPENPACLIQEQKLRQLLLGDFESCEHSCYQNCGEISRITLGERSVVIDSDGAQSHTGGLLVLSTGYASRLVDFTDLSVPRQSDSGLWVASYDCPAVSGNGQGQMDYVLGLDQGRGFGYRISKDGMLTVGTCLSSTQGRAVSELIQMSGRLVERGLIPADWQTHAAGTKAEWSPAGLALEMESHVAKRSLIIGESGGFVASYTNEAIYPGLWSAKLAIEVVLEAIMSGQPQDRLREFESSWRMKMADYLRKPNTDSQSLMPLVFSNQQMANKMLESLQLGLNF